MNQLPCQGTQQGQREARAEKSPSGELGIQQQHPQEEQCPGQSRAEVVFFHQTAKFHHRHREHDEDKGEEPDTPYLDQGDDNRKGNQGREQAGAQHVEGQLRRE
jgi:hypothetical protein